MNDRLRLLLHEFHQNVGAQFTNVNGAEAVADYGDMLAEHAALHETAGVLDLSFRSRLCLTGADRVRFLHGQVTNDVKKLRIGEGCYAALVTAKGKMESDLNIFCLQDELLLDFEPGLAPAIAQRLDKYIVADDVQLVDAAPHYGLLSVQGTKAEAVVRDLSLFTDLPSAPLGFVKSTHATLGEMYLTNHRRLTGNAGILPARSSGEDAGIHRRDASAPGASGFDLFIPSAALAAVAEKLITAARSIGGRACGWTALETARIEAGIPRFGADMDETNIPLECGIEARAISYTKGCYIGQEIINRIHTVGHVNRELRGLRLGEDVTTPPAKGEKLFKDGKEVGYLTSTISSPTLKARIALGYVRREANAVGTELTLRANPAEGCARIVELPFVT